MIRFDAVGEERREEEREQHLPELGGLEAEEADVDPAARAARGRAGDEHERHQPERRPEDQPAEAPVDGRVDQRRDDEDDAADRRVQRLPADRASPGSWRVIPSIAQSP